MDLIPTKLQLPDDLGNDFIADVVCRYLFIYIDGEYKFIQYVEAKNQEEAEQKVEEGWIRVVELVEDMQVVYNGR